MGGGPRFQYPKEVWSPAGGWWAFPRAWRANTAVACLLTAAICVPVFLVSEQRMVRVGDPSVPIPWRPGLKVADDQ